MQNRPSESGTSCTRPAGSSITLWEKKVKITNHFDTSSIIVIVITFVLFTIALFTKGFEHDLLLEAGVFLVSVKLILMGYNNSVMNKKLLKELEEIKNLIKKDQDIRPDT
jgi:hypothetical protein